MSKLSAIMLAMRNNQSKTEKEANNADSGRKKKSINHKS
jgi:hypothetical protein